MARIRSVKPEFWSHRILSKEPDSVKLLALALLNFCDDEGYFLIDFTILRNFARPRDKNTTKTKEAFDALLKIGYVIESKNPEYGNIGKVANFLTHQAIQRPKPSKLKQYFNHVQIIDESLIDHVQVNDESMLEQGSGIRDQGTGGGRAHAYVRKDTPAHAHTDGQPQDENYFFLEFEEIHEQLTSRNFQNSTCAGKSWKESEFYEFTINWLENKKASGDYQYKLSRLKYFLIYDYEKKINNKNGRDKQSSRSNAVKNPEPSEFGSFRS